MTGPSTDQAQTLDDPGLPAEAIAQHARLLGVLPTDAARAAAGRPTPRTVEAVLDDLLAIGRALGREPEARAAVVSLRERLFRAEESIPAWTPPLSALCLMLPPDPAAALLVTGRWVTSVLERAAIDHTLNPSEPPDPRHGAAAGPQRGVRRTPEPYPITPEDLVRRAAARPADALILVAPGLPGPPVSKVDPFRADGPVDRRVAALLDRLPRTPPRVLRDDRLAVPGPGLIDAHADLIRALHGPARPGP